MQEQHFDLPFTLLPLNGLRSKSLLRIPSKQNSEILNILSV